MHVSESFYFNIVGVLSSRWRLPQKPIIASPCNAIKIVKAMCVLHNMLRTEESSDYGITEVSTNADTTFQLSDIAASASRNSSVQAAIMRDRFAEYFVSKSIKK